MANTGLYYCFVDGVRTFKFHSYFVIVNALVGSPNLRLCFPFDLNVVSSFAIAIDLT